MQVLHDTFFYHSNPRLGADGDLENERQFLVEEQKHSKAQARKFSLETNRRRKALDERRKLWDLHEQQLRENILQQRRERVQEATERFQRAHLPPSERHRPSFRRNLLTLDDALHQIQYSVSPYRRQNSLTSNANISRSCTPSPKPPAVSKSSHRQALTAVEAYSKLLQEQSKAEKQQEPSPQGNHVKDSESLSSKDSLENENVRRSVSNPPSSFSFFLDSEKTHQDLRKQNVLYPTSDQTSSSGTLLLGNNLDQSGKLFEHKLKKQEDSQWPHNKMLVSEASWDFASVQKTSKTETGPPQHNSNILSMCEITSGGPEHCEINSPQNSPRDNINVTVRDTTSNTACESSWAQKETLLEHKNHDVRLLKYLSATDIPLPAKNGNSKDALFESPSKPNISFNDSATDNLLKEGAPQHQNKHQLSSPNSPSASMNNLNKVLNSQAKSEKPLNSAQLQHAYSFHGQSQKCHESREKEVRKVQKASSRPPCEVRFLKGILKKQSKYMSAENPFAFGAGHLLFAKQVALTVRDSMELTRAKTKDTEGSDTVKKKLRWLDEVQVEKESKEQNGMKHVRGKSFKSTAEDHQLGLSTVSGTPQPGPWMTPAPATGYHFTKEAWADVGVQLGVPQERSDEVKMPRSNTRTGGPRVPRIDRPAWAGSGLVSSRTRKGAFIRPQSATEVSQIAKTQGKMMTPRPPPRMDAVAEKMAYTAKTPYGLDLTSIRAGSALQGAAAEQNLHRGNSGVYFSPYARYGHSTDSGAVYARLPPSSFTEGDLMSLPSSGHPQTHSRRRGTACSEKSLCLDCTPTDEEILRLWHGVRSALTTKDAKNTLRKQATESGRGLRKPCVQPPGSANRRLLQTSQPSKQNTQLARPFPNTSNMPFPREGFESAAQFHLAEVHAEERDIAAAMETAQTQRPRQQQGLTNISMEEQKILQSLERLNHQLHCVQEYVGRNAATHRPALLNPSHAGDMKAKLYKRWPSSANSRPRHPKTS